MAQRSRPDQRQQQTPRRDDQRGEPVKDTEGCSGYCHVQTYEIRFTGNTVTRVQDNCPALTPEDIKGLGKQILPDKTLQRCQDGENCVCTPRAVPSDDPSWSNWVERRLREPRTIRKVGPQELNMPVGFCDYVISGSIEIRSRIDNDAVCLPGGPI